MQVMAFSAPASVMPHDTGPVLASSSFSAHQQAAVEAARRYRVHSLVADLSTLVSFAGRQCGRSIATEAAHCWRRRKLALGRHRGPEADSSGLAAGYIAAG